MCLLVARSLFIYMYRLFFYWFLVIFLSTIGPTIQLIRGWGVGSCGPLHVVYQINGVVDTLLLT